MLKNEAGSALLVLPYGARVLGLFPGEKANLLWENPCLQDPNSALEFFQTPGWRNTGGDRTWISPERDIHLPKLEDPWNSYEVTESIDPGEYAVYSTEKEVRLVTDGQVTQHRVGRDCKIKLEKTIRLIPNPLRYETNAGPLLNQVTYAGFEQITSLRYADMQSDFQPVLSIWDAVNLPTTGKVIIPTTIQTKPKDFFEPSGATHLSCSPYGISFLFDGQERHKIAIRSTDLLGGRVGYFRRINANECSLVVRNFAIDPSGEYVDTPWDNPRDRGYVIECYNDGGVNGAYGELEYHSPAMGNGTGQTSCLDRAQLWGFQGSIDHIAEIMRRLLGRILTDELFREGML